MGLFTSSIVKKRAKRLVEERDRLGLSQREAARLFGVTFEEQVAMERHQSSPSFDYHSSLLSNGVDPIYVEFGVRAVDVAAGLPHRQVTAWMNEGHAGFMDAVAEGEASAEIDWEVMRTLLGWAHEAVGRGADHNLMAESLPSLYRVLLKNHSAAICDVQG